MTCSSMLYSNQYYNEACYNEVEVYLQEHISFFLFLLKTYEQRPEKTNILVSDLVRHKPGCTATEDG